MQHTRRCSISAHASPPPASINNKCTNTLPRSWTGARSPDTGTTADNASPKPKPSAKRPNANKPACAATCPPPPVTLTSQVLLTCISEMPLSVEPTCASQHTSSHIKGAFPRTRTPQPQHPHERSGLVIWVLQQARERPSRLTSTARAASWNSTASSSTVARPRPGWRHRRSRAVSPWRARRCGPRCGVTGFEQSE